jgi:hypothetical protein
MCITCLWCSCHLPVQAATWEILSSIMQRYLHTYEDSSSCPYSMHSRGSDSSSCCGARHGQDWQQEAAAAWRQLVLQVVPSRDASSVMG